VLKICILPLNFPKWGIVSPKFCIFYIQQVKIWGWGQLPLVLSAMLPLPSPAWSFATVTLGYGGPLLDDRSEND